MLFGEVAFKEWLKQADAALKDRFESLFAEHLYAIRQYKFPANTLPAGIAFSDLVRIFDKLNRLGEPLDTFDLLVARMLIEDFRLREREEEAQKRFAAIGNGFTVSGLDVIKLISLEEPPRGLLSTKQVPGGSRPSARRARDRVERRRSRGRT